MNRYQSDRMLGGSSIGSAAATSRIRKAISLGFLEYDEILIKESQRLDHLAHEYLGNSMDWWILAATSNIGWGMQVPPGTVIRIPRDLEKLKRLV